ncbi:uridylate-specific endoribonuclease C-like [Myxocyprinus asiaticus]|uniref:uridylate-specific endoribonuclease C-like n=1 Tax=Myxocyprinus asiaticus TaxID=70543 RepID=UPI002223DFBC|nr:uridylate-specific endoribonuclease C-like [Myxocyprinus asiaticus]
MARGQDVNKELSDVLNELWRLDVNRMKPGVDYKINLQGKAGFVSGGRNNARDSARVPLFSYVNEDKLKSIDTYAYFINLLDNYEMATGVAEQVTEDEIQENHLFLDAILKTKVMKCAHKYLVRKGRAQSDPAQFKSQLYDIWFKLYRRAKSGGEDSCGFEHVFIGETKHGTEIMGLHNWVQFYKQEKKKHVDYKGYNARDNKDTPDEDDHLLNLQFSSNGLVKPLSSCFIGVSPEFEMALFTIVFFLSDKQMTTVKVKVDEYLLEIVVCRFGHSIGTSYPKMISNNDQDR